jgi:hypothetical protein
VSHGTARGAFLALRSRPLLDTAAPPFHNIGISGSGFLLSQWGRQFFSKIERQPDTSGERGGRRRDQRTAHCAP